jgi:multidrug efflux system membrane fusion protein
LFEMDARAYRVECDRARAEVQRAESQMRGAETIAARVKRLRELANASTEEGDRAQAAVEEARANLLVAKAGLQRTQLDLDATRITAPIDGQTGGATLTAGNLAAPTTTLVTIVAADPIYVSFDVAEREVPALQKLLQRGALTVLVGLAGDTGFPRRGTVELVDNRVNPQTGTVGVRATLPNPARDILPGMFVRVRLTAGEPREELLVPQRAVTSFGGDVSFVLVAGRDNTIEYRAVTLGEQRGDQIVVTAGIGRDDRVITSRPGELKPGAPIRVHEMDAGK